jgi:hypothetical protein
MLELEGQCVHTILMVKLLKVSYLLHLVIKTSIQYLIPLGKMNMQLSHGSLVYLQINIFNIIGQHKCSWWQIMLRYGCG